MKSVIKRPVIVAFVLCLTISMLFLISSFSNINAVETQKTIGILMSSDYRMPKIEGLKKGLEGYQFVEGEQVKYLIKNANSNYDLLPGLAEELINEKPDVVFVTGESEALAAQKAAQRSQIPIVFVGVNSASELGLIDRNSTPGNNITGVENYYVLLAGKRLEYFKRLLPEIEEIMVVYDPRITYTKPVLPFLDEISQRLDITIRTVPVNSREEVLQLVDGMDQTQVNGIMLLCSELLESMTDDLSQRALEKRIPVMGVSENQTVKGLLASYGMPYYEQGLQASRLVAKVLHGEKASIIPVESPSKVEFVVNYETAKKLQLTLDPAGLTCVTKFVE